MESRSPSKKAELPPIPAKRYFTIGEVSELCGVKPHVLRYWEQEFTQLKPVKRRGNRRYYQHHEVLLVRRIRELLYEQGFTINGARNRLDENERSPRAHARAISNEMHAGFDAGHLGVPTEHSPCSNKYALRFGEKVVCTPTQIYRASGPALAVDPDQPAALLKPGDLLFWTSHADRARGVMVYLGGGQMVHAADIRTPGCLDAGVQACP